MALTDIGNIPARTDPGFPAWVDDFFENKFPNLINELNLSIEGFNNGSFSGTSTTSQTINLTTPKTFTTQSGLSFVKGMWLTITENTAATTSNNNMVARVQSYSGTSLVCDIVAANGSATIANWRIAISPPMNAVTKSEMRLETGAGYGSVNTFIRNFVNATINTGSAITGGVSATNGASFTIGVSGVYAITYHEPAGAVTMHISKNAASLIAAPAVAERLASSSASAVSTINYIGTLNAGDIIRAHPGTAGLTATTGSFFHIVKLGIG